MELLPDSIAMVSLAVAAAALYARVACTRLRPGLPRLAALLPVIAFLAAVPMSFSSPMVRGISAFILAWLGVFKVALLAAGRGPLDPALPVLPFVFTTALPVKLKRHHDRPDAAAAAMSSGAKSSWLVSCAVKVSVIAAVIHLLQFKNLHLNVRLVLFGIHLYCFLDLILPCIAAAGSALGMELEPQFNKPYLASSLRDFWGRRWNLMASAILRPSVYDPVRARAGKPAGVFLTFIVSGLMHEVITWYLTWLPPTGETVAFFLLHGACCVAEDWCARRWAVRGWPPPPRPVATAIVAVLVMSTTFWLFFPPLYRGGAEEMLLEEYAALAAGIADARRKLLRYV
ncbi:hypothetical protein SEVIR_8G133200v4 [Setaria viridis]|uniref:Wax synthase domain-containing protein n=2 Tax=Setaria TaxID=4554 RepID=K3ZJ40_SETIT|nr:probable long-chain-alcohol O-fatty-acyltransferase 4 [Setaria italica]XP_034569361.1 probable long-chain-alcohol O-fatty-acyltransferase 4 [Setaria viridis]RCV38242.1 hypothetical protein SETIT_8G126200v2 [Setaria italica]TKW00767.1 hypothetical protein SEVIR_8G133200v2 [Setaria viridis]